MTKLSEFRLIGTTSAAGAVTVTAERPVKGYLDRVTWVDGTLADGVDAVLTVTNTPAEVNETLLTLTDANADAVYRPREVVHGNTGTALTGTAGGDRVMPIVSGLLSLAITDGGSALTGGAIVYIVEA